MATTLPARAETGARPARTTATTVSAPATLAEIQKAPGPSAVTVATAAMVAGGAVLFAALIGAVYLFRAAADRWPPEGVRTDFYLGNTIVLTTFLVSFSAQWARQAAKREDRRGTIVASGLTLLLGLAVVVIVWFALQSPRFGPGDHPYGALYFTTLGAFLLGALAASGAALLSLLRALADQFRRDDHGMVSATALGWHFLSVAVVALWLGLWVVK